MHTDRTAFIPNPAKPEPNRKPENLFNRYIQDVQDKIKNRYQVKSIALNPVYPVPPVRSVFEGFLLLICSVIVKIQFVSD